MLGEIWIQRDKGKISVISAQNVQEPNWEFRHDDDGFGVSGTWANIDREETHEHA